MDPLLERVEFLAPVGVEDHELAVEHVAALGNCELGEVAAEWFAVT